LVGFGQYVRRLGVDDELKSMLERLKEGPSVIYGMGNQVRMLIDANVVGESRVMGLEMLAADPLFTYLAGGIVPSIDTTYRDLTRFDSRALEWLDGYMAMQGMQPIPKKSPELHLDVDTTVETVFGNAEGAEVGYNPRYPGRPSYHPVLARIAETDTCVGAQLRPGSTAFGDAEAPLVGKWIERIQEHVGKQRRIWVRIDSAGDCAEILHAIDSRGAKFVVKAKCTPDLVGAVHAWPHWRTVERDADNTPLVQVADVAFRRDSWKAPYRVVAVRRRDRDSGRQLAIWEDLDYGVTVYLTNEHAHDGEDIAVRYDRRAGIEPLIAEAKGAWGIGDIPCQSFAGNHAMLLIKLLAANLLRRYVAWTAPGIAHWRTPWVRRALINRPGIMTRSGRRRSVKIQPGSCLAQSLG
jgi:hypothetical protein